MIVTMGEIKYAKERIKAASGARYVSIQMEVHDYGGNGDSLTWRVGVHCLDVTIHDFETFPKLLAWVDGLEKTEQDELRLEEG